MARVSKFYVEYPVFIDTREDRTLRFGMRDKLKLLKALKKYRIKIGEDAQIESDVILGCNVEIDDLARVEKDATIGHSVRLESSVVVGPETTIEDSTVIRANTIIERKVHVGENCDIGAESILYEGVSVGRASYIAKGTYIHQCATIADSSIIDLAEVNGGKDIPPMSVVVSPEAVTHCLVLGPLGSRRGMTTFMFNSTTGNIYVNTGCFSHSLAHLKDEVAFKYKRKKRSLNHALFYREYALAWNYAEAYFERHKAHLAKELK